VHGTALPRLDVTGTTLAFVLVVMDSRRLELTDLLSRALDVHEHGPFTRSAAMAALAVGSEDRRRRKLGIPSIFEPPPPVQQSGCGAP
jgi:hypothetical protein